MASDSGVNLKEEARPKGGTMTGQHANLFIPQWQGGGDDLSTYQGGMDIKEKYLGNAALIEIPVSLEGPCAPKNDMVNYEAIFTQTKEALNALSENQPDTIFTFGGGCDADIAPISYLNKHHNGIALIYYDSHGDIHSPQSSDSKLFYGMPVRTLLGDGDDALVALLPSTLTCDQIIYVGTRDLDVPEAVFIKQNNITTLPVEIVEADPTSIVRAVHEKGFEKIYIHIDLDVIDPEEFPHVPLLAPEGLSLSSFSTSLQMLKREFTLVGLGLFEYLPAETKLDILDEIVSMGTRL